ncbi:AraC family transcriptional regulator ligand-binding domain-containing protein [Fulvivirgaceae bacterium BMA10]|uniref:AraC family transcriptional regulator ligand-binding domain-containing protein n=1 Tax=Splendidivirga corallicola TaxID=3051826 RepID=A0ABT8KNJ6_9BACT|nr:AraC family transcriptional regulator ligand-binding domain-containing protein [Fulvivirgaceae bacterium BMA10]
MSTNYLVSTALVRSRAKSLMELGLSQENINEIIGLSIQELDDFENFVMLDKLVRLEIMASEMLGSEELALRVSRECETVGDANSGLIGTIAASCNTIGEAFDIAVKYKKLLSDGIHMELATFDEKAEFIYHRKTPEIKTVFDAEISIIESYDILRNFGNIFEVQFEHPQPNYVSRYNDVFNCGVKFNCSVNKIVFDSSILGKENPQSQPYVNKIVSEYAERMLTNLDDKHTCRKKVIRIITDHIASGQVSADFVAEKLNTSRQSLYRRLKAEGITFKELLDQVRKELASTLMKSQKNTLIEIAFLLGFSELSSFSRAYKKWFSRSPSELRKA